MRLSYPKFSLEGLRVDMYRAVFSCGQSIGVRISFDRTCGLGGESAALGSYLSRCDGRVLWTTPVREFLRNLITAISDGLSPKPGRWVFDAGCA